MLVQWSTTGNWREMNHQPMKDTGQSYVHMAKERIQSEEATWSMTPLRTSRKDKATQMIADHGMGVC